MFMNFLINFWLDLHEAQVWWQIIVIALCVLTSYFFSQFLRRRFFIDTNFSEADDIAAQSLISLVFPATLLVFLCVGKLILLNWENAYLLTLLIPIVGSLVLIRFGIYLSRRIFARNYSISSLHLLIEKMFSAGVWLLVIFYYTGLLYDMLTYMSTHTIPLGQNNFSILKVTQVLISVVATVLLALWASAVLEKRLMKVDSLDLSLRIVLSKLSRSLLIVVALLVGLNLVGIDLTVLSIFGGALGVGLGLGLQKIASSYVSGFIILFDRSLAVDDLITVDKFSAKVSKITTRYTVLKGLDGVESVMPNDMLISSPVQNSSSNDKGIGIRATLTVAYHTDIEALLPMLIKVTSGVEGVSTIPAPNVFVDNLGVHGFELSNWFWITRPENNGPIISKVNRTIWTLLQEQNIEIAYPQAEITVREGRKVITDTV